MGKGMTNTIKSILIHEYRHKLTWVNTNQHESDTNQHETNMSQHESTQVQHELTQINTSPTRVNTNQHKSKTSLDYKIYNNG